MNRNLKPRTRILKHSRQYFVSTFWLWCAVCALAAPLFAQAPYLAAGHPDGIALLAPPPAAGSAEAAADLASVRAVFSARTPAEEARAIKDSGLAFSLFAPA